MASPSSLEPPAKPNGDICAGLGERLRDIRMQKRWSLQDVEARSSDEFKASVLGAYERGERSISVSRLCRLAQLYDVPVSQLLPNEAAKGASVESDVIDLRDRIRRPAFSIDLAKVAAVSHSSKDALSRFVAMIQVERQDFNGRVLTVRRDDLRAIACILGLSPEETEAKLSTSPTLGTSR
ncbi:MAG: transcriptional regulator [Acidimicrobiia bacterium]